MSCFSKDPSNTSSFKRNSSFTFLRPPDLPQSSKVCERAGAKSLLDLKKRPIPLQPPTKIPPFLDPPPFGAATQRPNTKGEEEEEKEAFFDRRPPPSACLFEDVRIPPSRLRTKGQGIQQRWVGISTGGKTISTSLNREIGNKVGMAECQLTYLPLTCFTAKKPSIFRSIKSGRRFLYRTPCRLRCPFTRRPWPAAQ